MHQFDKTWTLFLDRDGVINQRIPGGYVTNWDDFNFIPGSIKAIEKLAAVFGTIVIVTNQAGIGKGQMTEKELYEVHRMFLKTVDLLDGRIDKIYYAPDASPSSPLRKPNIGMALQAKEDFPEIEFSRSVIVGDSISDMLFGEKVGMVKVFIEGKGEVSDSANPDYIFPSLHDFAKYVAQELLKNEDDDDIDS